MNVINVSGVYKKILTNAFVILSQFIISINLTSNAKKILCQTAEVKQSKRVRSQEFVHFVVTVWE